MPDDTRESFGSSKIKNRYGSPLKGADRIKIDENTQKSKFTKLVEKEFELFNEDHPLINENTKDINNLSLPQNSV